jgi:uncharacterized protein (DUF1330 family)
LRYIKEEEQNNMKTIEINKGQFIELLKNPNDKSVVMLNLLKFKKEGGRKSYARYLKEANRFIDEVGGKLLIFSRPKELLTGTETWDLLMLVKYPSRKAFLAMANNPEYLKIHSFREEALENAVLYATDEISLRDLLQDE